MHIHTNTHAQTNAPFLSLLFTFKTVSLLSVFREKYWQVVRFGLALKISLTVGFSLHGLQTHRYCIVVLLHTHTCMHEYVCVHLRVAGSYPVCVTFLFLRRKGEETAKLSVYARAKSVQAPATNKASGIETCYWSKQMIFSSCLYSKYFIFNSTGDTTIQGIFQDSRVYLILLFWALCSTRRRYRPPWPQGSRQV